MKKCHSTSEKPDNPEGKSESQAKKSCKFCDKTFESNIEQKQHVQLFHEKPIKMPASSSVKLKKPDKVQEMSENVTNSENDQASKADVNEQEFESPSNSNKPCKYCEQTFESDAEIEKHILMSHENVRSKKVERSQELEKAVSSIANKKADVESSNPESPSNLVDYDTIVEKESNSPKDAINNSYQIEPTSRRIKCQTCYIDFDRSAIKNHISTEHPEVEKIQCLECSYFCYEKGLLISHNKIEHKGTKDFKCKFCDKEFKRQAGLIYHARGIHEGKLLQIKST